MEKRRFRILSLSGLFDKVTEVHKKTIVPQLLSALIIQFCVGLIAALTLGIFFIIVVMSIVSSAGIQGSAEPPMILVILIVLTVTITALFASFMVNAGAQKIASDSYFGYRTTFSAGVKYAFAHFGKLLYTAFAYACVVLVVSIVLIIIPVVAILGISLTDISMMGSSDMAQLGVISVIGMILYGILLIFIYWVIATLYVFVVPVTIFEKKAGFKALKRSRELIKGEFWRSFGKVGMMNLITQGISSSMFSILGIIGLLLFFVLNNSLLSEGSEGAMTALSIGGNLIQYPIRFLIAAAITPLAALFSLVFFYNMKMKKEGYDFEVNLFFMQKEKGSVDDGQ